MRIALVNTRADSVGGSQIHVRDLAAELIRRGHEACVFVGGTGAGLDILIAAGVPYVSLRYLQRNIHPLHDYRAYRELKAALADFRPDLISTHTSKAGILGRRASRALGVPSIFTAHGWNFAEGIRPIVRASRARIERIAAKWCDRIITVSEADRLLALEHEIAPAEKVIAIHNAMPDIDGSLCADPAKGVPKLMMVARFETQKDHATLITALAALTEMPWTLELIGGGPLEDQTRAQVAALNLTDRVTFAGPVNNVAQRMCDAQVFLLISRWEGLPRSIIEAMRAGLPVVASDVGGVREQVIDGTTGFLIERGDALGLQQRLAQLLGTPALRAAMGQAGRKVYEQRFTFSRMVDQTYQVYEAVLREREVARSFAPARPAHAQRADSSVSTQLDGAPLPSPRLKVALVLEAAAGGAGRHTLDLAEGLIARGCDVHLMYSVGRLDQIFVTQLKSIVGLNTHTLDLDYSLSVRNLLVVRKVRKILAQYGPFDIVHGHSSIGGAMARLSAVSTGALAFYTPHGFQLMDPGLSRTNRVLYSTIEKLLSYCSQQIIAVSPEERDALVRNGIDPDSVTLIPNGIRINPNPPTRAQARLDVGLPDDAIVVGYVGRLVEQKAVDVLLRAFREMVKVVPHAKLAIVGSGPLESMLRGMAEEMKLTADVVWLGERDARCVLPAFDIFALSSRKEGLPYVILEAMAVMLPVIATAGCSVSTLVADMHTGVVVPNDDYIRFANGLILVAANKDLRLQFGRNGLHRASELTVDGMVSRTFDTYLAAVNKRHPRSRMNGASVGANQPSPDLRPTLDAAAVAAESSPTTTL